MPNDYSPNSAARRRAIALNAVDAQLLLIINLPVVLSSMTTRQLHKVQKVLDAAVVNPVIKAEADDLYRRSVTHKVGELVIQDPKMERRADQINQGMIWVTEKDKHIRLDFEKLLASDALEPRTDNPDEAEYLLKVRRTLEKQGVWLRITQPLVRDPNDSKYGTNPHNFEVWLSLGYGGEAIPTATNLGLLDRDAILGNQVLGAHYYEEVSRGKVQRGLETQIALLDDDIADGEKEHNRLIKRYENATPGVAEISDAVGGADLPSRSIWNDPKKMLLKARDLNVHGDVMGSQAYLVVAAIATRDAAQSLTTYADKSTAGAGSFITILEVAKTAGEIAGVCLTVTGVAGLARGVVGRVSAEESVDALAERVVNQYISKNAEGNNELLRMVGRLNSPKGSIGGGVKPGSSLGAGTGWSKW